jgi:subfamily B ATP-binding cassette protein MsbA
MRFLEGLHILERHGAGLYARLLGYVKPYWLKLVIGMSMAAVISVSTAAIAWLVKPALDEIFLKKDMTMLMLLPIAILIVFLIKGLSTYGQACLMRDVGQRVVRDIRDELYTHLQTMPLSFFHRNPSAVLMSRITNDVGMLATGSSALVADIVREGFTVFGLVGVMFYRDWRLCLLTFVIFPWALIPMKKIGARVRMLSRKSREKMAEINKVVQEAFTGIKIVKAFGMEDYEKQRFKGVNQRLYDLAMKGVRTAEISSPLMEFIGSLGAATVIWYGGYQVIKGAITPGTFFSFMTAVMMMYGPIRKLSRINNAIQTTIASMERVFEILDTPRENMKEDSGIVLRRFQKDIEFRNIWFRYNDHEGSVLRDINLDVERGEVVAFVGVSGVGKSTLCDLIPRFYDVSRGSIRIDGLDLRDINIKSLRQQIGIVTQETILFNDTVRNNIAYGRIGASFEEIVHAAELAFAHDFIVRMKEGYDTVIGEKGVRLSGGERQRIAIARALLRNPAILILDEATSDLDSESELMVQRALDNLMKNRTTFVIAHRLSTVRNAHKIVVLEDGKIVEMGKHGELLAKNGVYKRLHEVQFGAIPS